MHILTRILILALLLSLPGLGSADSKRASLGKTPVRSGEVQQTYADITKTFGFVPTFMKNYPEKALVGAWSEFKAVQLNPNSAIPPRYKELIGLAVSSQIPCHYCTYFHTTAAKANGATRDEINEAIALSASTRHWSTFMVGTQEEEGRFEYMLRMIKKRSKELAKHPHADTAKILSTKASTRDQAFEQMTFLLGSVPNFMRNFPEAGVVGAWNNVKALHINPEATSIPSKYKALICLAVSSQVPCDYCVRWDTQDAELEGATPAEINEAVAMSSIVRQWSTVLNGAQTDMGQFKKELAQVFSPKEAKTKLTKKTRANRAHS